MNLDRILEVLRVILTEGRGREHWIFKIIVITLFWGMAFKIPQTAINKLPVTFLFLVSVTLPIAERILERLNVI